MYVTPAFPVTDLTSVGDATQIVRPSIDGFTGAVSLQSANFPDRYMAPLADGYLFYVSFESMFRCVDHSLHVRIVLANDVHQPGNR